ncbi:MAG: hypothetical protein QNJ65_22300 [Xenococcaceae cyanobacterium MO_234.B1]|nr:hypothetical protein [Xenococcaceae cyanobacterium MO_234.B1]
MNEIEYNLLKVEIFTDINDTPIAPTADRGGNISHLYSQFNQLINIVFRDLTTLSETINAINSRIEAQLPPATLVTEEFVFSNITTSDVNGNNRATLGTMPKNGTLKRITIDGINDEYSNYFIIVDSFGEEYYLTEWSGQTITDGFEWTFEEAVTEGQTIIFQSSVIETNRTIKLYIEVEGYTPIIPTIEPPSEPSEPILETFSFSNLTTTLIESKHTVTVGTIPKTGQLQRIAIDNINSPYDTFFKFNDNVAGYSAIETSTEGYQWTMTIYDYINVVQGEEIIMETTSTETNRTVYLDIFG